MMKEKTVQEDSENTVPGLPNPTSHKKILYIITKSVFGGAGRYVFELAKRSKEEGLETAVALGGNGELFDKLKAEGIQTFPLSHSQRDMHLTKEIRLLFQLIKIVRTFKPTVIHLNSPKIGGLGAVVGRLLFVPHIIYTNHGWSFKEDRPEWQLVLIRFFSWLTIFFNKKVIVLSEAERNFVEKWPFAYKKLEVIPNGLSEFKTLEGKIALQTLLAKQPELAQKIHISENTLILGTISELHKNKGLTYAIEGIRMFLDQYPEKNIVFLVIGEGERRAELQNLIIEKNLTERVLLVGKVDNAREYLSAFDIFLLSSVKEGLPYAILEAGAVGIPVISTSVGGIPEVIQNFKTGLLIPPRRPQEIKNALVYFEEHPEMVSGMTTNLKKLLAEKFDFNTIYKRIIGLY